MTGVMLGTSNTRVFLRLGLHFSRDRARFTANAHLPAHFGIQGGLALKGHARDRFVSIFTFCGRLE